MEKIKQHPRKEQIDQLETNTSEELAKLFVDTSDIGKDKDGYVVKAEWEGKAVKKKDLDKVEEIENNYKKQKYYLVEGDNLLKELEKKLEKIKKDDTFINTRTSELIEQGYSEEDAKEIAELESKIKNDTERQKILEESLEISNVIEKKIKDVDKRLDKAKENILNDSEKLKLITDREKTKTSQKNNNKEPENEKSKGQLLRDAGNAFRNVKVDNNVIEKTKQDFIDQNYKTEDAEKIGILTAEILADEKRIIILQDNPKIQNGLKELGKIKNRIEINKKELEILISNSEKIKEEEPKKDTENKEVSKYPFVWKREESRDNNPGYNYERGDFVFNINGKESYVIVFEEKTKWKPQTLKRILGLSESGKEVFKKKPTWCVAIGTENKKLEKYRGKYQHEFKTKEEAIDFADKMIDKGMKIKDEEEGKYMPKIESEPEPLQPKSESTKGIENSPSRISNTFPPFAYIHQTPAEAKSAEIKKEMEDAENKRVEKLTPEEMLERLSNTEQVRKNNIETSKGLGAKIIRGFDRYESYGKGETGPKGFAKRMTKVAINLALVGAISSISVDQLAKAGIGSATALGAGVTSNILRKFGMGLGFSAAFEGANAIKSNNKYVGGFKKALPYMISAGAIGVSLAGGAYAVGAASALGLFASKVFKGAFTKEKIESRQGRAREKLLAEIKARGKTIDERDIAKFERKMEKILKKYERQRIYGRIIDGVLKLTIASAISSVVLEASGITQDHIHNQNIEKTPTENTNGASDSTQDSTKTNNSDTTNMTKTPPPTASDTNQTPDSTNVGHNQNIDQSTGSHIGDVKQSIDNVKMDDILVHKGEGIENSFIRQIEHNHELAKELGFKGDFNDTKALHEFAGRQAHVIAIKEGYVDNNGGEVRIAEADKIGYEIKMENGHVSVVERTSGGDIVETHHEGDKFEEQIDKGEYIKEHNVSQTVHTDKIEETHHIPEGDTNFIVPEQVNAETGETIDLKNIQETPHVEENGNFKVPEQVDVKTDTTGTDHGNNIINGSEIVRNGLTQVEIDHVHDVFNNNIDHLFSERPRADWETIQKNISAERIFELAQKGEIAREFSPLVEHMSKLEKLTDVHPYTQDILHPDGPETIPHFIGRALEEAEKIGVIDQVTL